MNDKIELGKLIKNLGDANRDAIHIAVAPVTAYEKIAPAQEISLGRCIR